jgi:hypothetical protein
MLQYYRVVSALLGLVLCLTSCNVETIDDPIIVPLIEQEFQLDLWQTLGRSTPSNLEIQMSTIEEEDCLNALILSTYVRTGSELNITIYDILEPEVCDPGSAPARGEQEIVDATPGTYNIKIEIQDIVSNLGFLTVSEEAYTIDMLEETGITWLNKTLYRIPNDALWGYVAYTNTAEENRVTTLIEELRALGTPLTLAEGYYGYFTISNSGNSIKIQDAPNADSAKSLLLNYTAGRELINQKVSDFLSTSGNENIVLKLLDSAGNEWSNE